jgi:hypothetical protein
MNNKQLVQTFNDFLEDVRRNEERLEKFDVTGEGFGNDCELCEEEDFYEVRDYFQQWCEGHRDICKMDIQEAITGFLTVLKLDRYVTVNVS